MLKQCSKCKKVKELRHFKRRKNFKTLMAKDKTLNVCKTCICGFDWKCATKKQKKDRMVELFYRRVVINEDNDGCWEWDGCKNLTGYAQIEINRIKHNASRVAWMIYRGDIPKGKYVCHKCDNRVCTNPDHLFIGSPRDNMLDMVKKGRNVNLKGEDCPWSKLTEEIITKVIKDLENDIPNYIVAKKHGIGAREVSRIRNGKTWKHLDIVKNNKIKRRKAYHNVLDESKAREIKKLFTSGLRIVDIMNKLNIARSTVDDVVKCRTWKHIN